MPATSSATATSARRARASGTCTTTRTGSGSRTCAEPDGSHEAVSWDEAFAAVERLLVPILETHGPDAIGAYVGNPMGHSLAGSLYLRGFHKMLGTRSLYTVGTVDQQPKSLASGLLYGSQFTVGIPDVDRTSHLLVLGANPVVSNGSLIAAPDMRGRLRAIRARGGKVVVVDPVRTRTAREADEHHFIRPGTDALLLAAMAHTLFDEELVRLRGLEAHVGWPRRGAGLRRGVLARAGRSGVRDRGHDRSDGSHASSPPRRRRLSTAGSGRRCRRSARRRAGSSTC